jgi:hypothetical protein
MHNPTDLVACAATLGAAKRDSAAFHTWVAGQGIDQETPLFKDLVAAYAEAYSLRLLAERVPLVA